MTAEQTSYDAIAYPTLIFSQSHPDRLAVIARLHGLTPPPVDQARYLEIGGGDGLNATALATAYPRGEFVNFDIAALPIERARRWAEGAGVDNARHLQLDLLKAADTLEGTFDYIVAHGVYAWTPDVVRAAVMPQISRLLSPNGVAFVSYNAFPGGYVRLALRDLLFHHIGHIADPRDRIAAARTLLQTFVVPEQNDAPIVTDMRMEARVALSQEDGLLFHDQLNGDYAPQALTTVVADARAHGLRYLGDARGGGLDLGFLDPDKAGLSEEAWIHALQSLDYRNGRYFRSSLFVRDDVPISRVVDHDAARTMWASTRARHVGGNEFSVGSLKTIIADDRRAEILGELIARKPGWAPVDTLATEDAMLSALCRQALEGIIDLHTTAPPFTLTVSEKPTASPLARMQIADGQPKVATLDHQMIELSGHERQLVALLDGSRDQVTLLGGWNGSTSLPDALQTIAAKALLVS